MEETNKHVNKKCLERMGRERGRVCCGVVRHGMCSWWVNHSIRMCLTHISYRLLPQSHFVLFEYFSMFVKFSCNRRTEKKQKNKRVLEKRHVWCSVNFYCANWEKERERRVGRRSGDGLVRREKKERTGRREW
jgi:hypothetical protein